MRICLGTTVRGFIDHGLFLDIVSWAHSAPAPSLKTEKKLRDLNPGTKLDFGIELFKIEDYHPRNTHSGYIVASCENCKKAKAWWFYFPQNTSFRTGGVNYELHEFEYLKEQPFGWFPKKE